MKFAKNEEFVYYSLLNTDSIFYFSCFRIPEEFQTDITSVIFGSR